MIEDLRRIPRVTVCCRVVVQDRHGIWSAVTEDLCARGARIVTPRLLRTGTLLDLTLASDLFPEELETQAVAVWSAPERLGVIFVESPRSGAALGTAAWVDKLLEHGATPESLATARLVPSVAARAGAGGAAARNGKIVRTYGQLAAPPPATEAAPVPLRRA